MDDSFRQKVSPVILYVLDVLDQIEFAPQAAPTPDFVRKRFKDLIGQFDVRGLDASQFRLAKGALVYWTDEVLINSTWEYATEWRNIPLELELFGTRNRAWLFFKDAGIARGLERTDALEVFALCVANGFQGVYRTGGIQIGTMQSDLVTAGSTASTASADHRASTESEVAGLTVPTEPNDEAFEVVSSLPVSLDEWTSSVFVHVLGSPLSAFRPGAPLDSSRNARPLIGAQSSFRWSLVLVAVVIITSCLIAISGW